MYMLSDQISPLFLQFGFLLFSSSYINFLSGKNPFINLPSAQLCVTLGKHRCMPS